MKVIHDPNEKFYFSRFGIDIMFFLTINLVLLSILFGIIYDSFTDFKDKAN